MTAFVQVAAGAAFRAALASTIAAAVADSLTGDFGMFNPLI